MKRFIIYKTTNLINGKFYIGKHVTTNIDDEYLGSGMALQNAIQKYGKNSFFKEILYEYNSEAKINLAEKILVVVDREISYNLLKGGNGSFSYINSTLTENFKFQRLEKAKIGIQKFWVKLKENPDLKEKYLQKLRSRPLNHLRMSSQTPSARQKRIETYRKIGISKGVKNSQYGTIWVVYNSVEKKIFKDEEQLWTSKGWKRGRKKRII